MPFFGGLSSSPLRFGGGTPALKIILESINAQMGSGYNTDHTSIVYVRNLALAKGVRSAWSLNRRLANQGFPMRLTTLLERTERMYGLPIDPSLNNNQRRQRIEDIENRRGESADFQFVNDGMDRIMGPVFGALEFITLADAVVHSPDGTYPWGTVVEGYPWYSTLDHLLVYTIKPSGWNEGQYRKVVGDANAFLDAVLPAWMTWTVYHVAEGHAGTSVNGAPSHGGFFLDTPNALDYNVFT